MHGLCLLVVVGLVLVFTCDCLFKIGYLSGLFVVGVDLFALGLFCLVDVCIVGYCLILFGCWMFAGVCLLWFASLHVVFLDLCLTLLWFVFVFSGLLFYFNSVAY